MHFRFVCVEPRPRAILQRFGLPELNGWAAAGVVFLLAFIGPLWLAALLSNWIETIVYQGTAIFQEHRRQLTADPEQRQHHGLLQLLVATIATMDMLVANLVDLLFLRAPLEDHFGAVAASDHPAFRFMHSLSANVYTGELTGKIIADLVFYMVLIVTCLLMRSYNGVLDRLCRRQDGVTEGGWKRIRRRVGGTRVSGHR